MTRAARHIARGAAWIEFRAAVAWCVVVVTIGRAGLEPGAIRWLAAASARFGKFSGKAAARGSPV